MPKLLKETETRAVHRWKELHRLELPKADIQQVAWVSRHGQLLVCGRQIALFQFPFELLSCGPFNGFPRGPVQPKDEELPSPELLWSAETPSLTYFCSVSPDGRYFVTAGQYDRLPKLWYAFYDEVIPDEPLDQEEYREPAYELCYRFSYLPHPRSVLSVQWRPGRRALQSIQNILLTTCMDGIARCWLEDQPYSFSTCAVIPGGPDNVFAWLHYHPFIREPFPSEEDDCESEEKLRCSLLRPRDPKREAIEQNERLYQLHREQGERFNSQLALEELLDSDWVVQVEKEHLVSFWQLSGITPRLGAHDAPSRAMPVLSLWLKTKVSRSYGFQIGRASCRERVLMPV